MEQDQRQKNTPPTIFIAFNQSFIWKLLIIQLYRLYWAFRKTPLPSAVPSRGQSLV